MLKPWFGPRRAVRQRPVFPCSIYAGLMRRVAVVVLEGAKPLDVGIPAQVFTARASMPYTVDVCGVHPGLITGGDGLSYHVEHGLEALETADLVFVPGYREPDRERPPQALTRALLTAHERGARLAAISTGAFALAETGLLDGRRATTHWHYSQALAERYPEVHVDERVLFVDEGSVLTSAGAASGIDLCLHILRKEAGMAVANHAARRLVAAPYRSGGQAQFVPQGVPESHGERFTVTRDWALLHLGEPLGIAQLAAHARVSSRTFSRRFRDETGYAPMQWIMRARVDRARELLEETDLGIDEIASTVGLGTATNLRRYFRRVLGTTPSDYRKTFSRAGESPVVA
ncbi:AraC family transcriptional regulator with amidase-like domain [Leucobacter luti]|nr:AraC family transcriptional regulator with amidase-like domain [Leucobacter luti]